MQGVDMGYERTDSLQNKNSRTPQPTTQFGSRPFPAPVQMKPKEQQTPEELENEAFNQNKFEAFGLQLKEKSGTITPVEQEQLGVLQAKMDDFWAQRQERASRSGFDFSKVSVTPPGEPAAPQIQPNHRLETPGMPLGGQRSLFNSPLQSSASPIQRKLTIGQPGDKYEQEADQVASQVVEQINSPKAAQSTQGQSVQRQEEPVEELQAKPSISELQRSLLSPEVQRESMPEEEEIQAKSILQRQEEPEEELQAKPSISELQRSPLSLEVQREAMPEEEDIQAKSILQRREAIAGGEASTDLDTAINSARGGGQPLEARLQRSMGQAMGADFSGVRVHTDTQADQLNQSIQAKAFTTGQDVFFRQGAYEPGSRGGQELIAHELTHVVQQNGGVATGEKIQMIQMKPPRRTEERILGEMAAGNGSLTAANSDNLIDKMDKDQSYSRARAIAAQIEAESDQLVSALPQPQQTNVRAAIKDYVTSSTAIQNDARNNPNAPNQAVQALDAALVAIRQQLAANQASNERIVYRSISYASGADIPYGQADQLGNIINVGDFVGDKGLLSTSEHRQFVLGKTQASVQGLLKLAIHGRSGVPIAINIPNAAYSNANEKAMYDMQQAKKNRLTRAWNSAFGVGPGAGQAEVLFPRNAVFEVKKIQRDGEKVSVVLEEFIGQRPPIMLNMKYGTPL
jgi:hypothetical protein